MSEDLNKAVVAVVRECLGVRPNEEVLVVCNPATRSMGEAMRAEAEAVGAEAVLAVITERDSHAGEPPATVAAAMVSADVLLAPTVQSLSHTAARKLATESGTRTATLPGATEEMLARVMSDDMENLRRRGNRVAEILDHGTEARITCDHGSDLTLGLQGRTAIPDAGELTHEGAFGNLPCGEGFISPATAEGILIVDGSIAGVGLVSEPVRLTIRDGHLVEASGPEGEKLMALLTEHGPDGTNVAELGIGTNEKAILTGNILEDEKIIGTAHVAFGASAAIGGNIQVPVHLDVVSLRPEVTVGDTPIVLEGKLLV
jgi:leucyl aminopeptidase (aminopeptidase T)